MGDGGAGGTIIGKGNVPVLSAAELSAGRSVSQVAAGTNHTCALLDNGALRCWGQGLYGQLGHDDTASVGAGGGGDTIMDAGDVPYF